MDRPLWQILFALSFAAFSVQRAAIAYTLYGDELHPVLLATYGLQLLAALATALGTWLERRWAAEATFALGVLMVASSLQAGPWLGLQPTSVSAIEALVVGAVSLALSRALRPEPGTKAPD